MKLRKNITDTTKNIFMGNFISDINITKKKLKKSLLDLKMTVLSFLSPDMTYK